MVRGTLHDGARGFTRSWWLLALIQLLSLLGMTLLIGVVALAVQNTSDSLLAWIASEADGIEDRAAGLTSALVLLLAVLTIPVHAAAVAATAILADAAIENRPRRVWHAVAAGVVRLFPVLLALLLAVLIPLLALVVAPVLVPLGLTGLAVITIRARLVHRGLDAADTAERATPPRWASPRLWVLLAIPFGVLWWVAAPAILLPVVAALEHAWPHRAVRVALHAARGHRWSVLAVWFAALMLALTFALGTAWLSELLLGELGLVLVAGLLQLIALPVPVVAAVALYRRMGALPPSLAARPRGRSGAPASPAMARIATVAIAGLVLPIAVTTVPVLAATASADMASTATFVVTSPLDSNEETVLAGQRDSCRNGGPDCTFRAALALAQQAAADGLSGAVIVFAEDAEISLVEPLRFSPDTVTTGGGAEEPPLEESSGEEYSSGESTSEGEESGEGSSGETGSGGGSASGNLITSGLLTIDSGGHTVVLDGGGAVQILSVVSEYWNLTVSGLSFVNGYGGSDFGGGLLAGVPVTTLDAVLFEDNRAGYGAGALFARELHITRSAFLSNRATGWQNSVLGGAIRATGAVTVENTSFSGNGVGDQFTPGINRGSDIYADAGMSVNSSTFVGSEGGSLASPGVASTLHNSLFTSDWTGGGLMCSGSFSGAANLSWQGDTSCPGTSSHSRLSGSPVAALDRSGAVPMYPLTPIGNVAIGAGSDCLATDVRGTARPAQGCDLGAVEFDGATNLVLSSTPDPVVFGSVVLRATVTAHSGVVPSGTVVFTVDGAESAPISVDSLGVAELPLSGLAGGAVLSYAAVFHAADPYDDASAGPLDYAVVQVLVPVDLRCSNPALAEPANAAECLGSTWRVTENGSIHLTAVISDDREGAVSIALDSAGAAIVAGPVAVVDGSAAFDLTGADLGGGQHELFAIYRSDDGKHAGVSSIPRPITVLLDPQVAVTMPTETAVYGDTVAAVATVTVTGSGPTPSGTATIDGRTGTLDANGVATIDLSDLSPSLGVSALTVEYSGDGNYGFDSSASVTFGTTRAGSRTEITGITPAGPAYGDQFDVEVTVTALAPSTLDPIGVLTLNADGVDLLGTVYQDAESRDGDGRYVFLLRVPAGALTAGDHELVAEFSGLGHFLGSVSDAAALTVGAAATTVALGASSPALNWGASLTLTATVDASDTVLVPSGWVEFRAGNTVLGTAQLIDCAGGDEGCATATIDIAAAVLGVGETALAAVYLGTDDFAAASSDAHTISVLKATPVVTVTAPAGTVFGAATTLTVELGPNSISPPDGTIVVLSALSADGPVIPLGTVSLTSGQATRVLVAGSLPPGGYTITASYAGDAYRASATGTASHSVTAATTNIDLDALSATTVAYGASLTATVTVENTANGAFPEGDVVLSWLGHEVGRATLSSADDTEDAGVRTLDVELDFGPPIPLPSSGWLTAEFVGAPGFADAHLSTDAHEERRQVTVTALQAVVAVEAEGILGHALQATATVTIPGAVGNIAPEGSVVFRVVTGGGAVHESSPTPLVHGVALLSDAFPAGVIVDIAGTWSIRATYAKSGTDDRYLVTSPNHTAIDQFDVTPGTTVLELDAPDSVADGNPLVVGVRVRGAVAATGLVQLRLVVVGGGTIVLDEETLVDGAATLSGELSPLLALGEHQFVVSYTGNGTLDATSTAPVSFSLGRTVTSVALTTTSKVLSLMPGIIGATVDYRATVTAVTGTPSGFVDFFAGETLLGSVLVNGNGVADLQLTPSAPFAGEIVARFRSLNVRMQDATASLTHSWIAAPIEVTLSGPAANQVGNAASYTVGVRLLWEQFPYLAEEQLPPTAPAGSVTVSDGAGASCVVDLNPLNTVRSAGTCSIDFASLGGHQLIASYAGGGSYAGGTSPPLGTTVAQGTPTLTLTTPEGENWAGLTSIPVSWRVDGPQEGSVTVRLGAETVCTSLAMSGSCAVTVPAYAATAAARTLHLEYSGSTLWKARSSTLVGTINACVPFAGSTSSTPGAATVTLSPEPNCGNGTGYWASTYLQVRATATEGYRITGLRDRGWPYASSQLVFGNDGSSVNAIVHPSVQTQDGVQTPMQLSVDVQARCIPVILQVSGISDRQAALNLLTWSTQSACGNEAVVSSSSSWTVMLEIGSQFRLGYQSGFIPQDVQFRGWSDRSGSELRASTASYLITSSTTRIVASFAPLCLSTLPALLQPDGGTLTLAMPATNCTDPETGLAGWWIGTTGTGELVDGSPRTRTFFDTWSGDTDRVTFGRTTTRLVDGDWVTVRPFTFTVTRDSFTVGASYGRCLALSTSILGESSSGVPGSIVFETASNCPLSAAASNERWYRVGTDVSLTASVTKGSSLKFLGWGGVPVTGSSAATGTVAFTLQKDIAVTASFGTWANCRPFSLAVMPQGSLSLETTFSLGGNACEPIYGSRFYDQGTSGNGVLIEASAATPEAEGAEIVFAWATSPPGSPSGQAPSLSSLWTRTTQLNEQIYGTTQIVAYACEFVAISANVNSPDGTLVVGAGASNIDRATQSILGDFVGTPEADCSTGADPRSGYGGYAWTVGTQLLPIVLADPVAYRFTGWSGDVAGADETPDEALALVGAGRRAQGDSYHYRVTANFTAICYTLSLPSDADKLEVLTAPNCPGVDASERKYLGGTAVVLHAPDKGDTLFRHWVSGTDAIDDDTSWASVVMTSDKTVIPYYSTKSAGEQLRSYGTLVGDSLAVASKKMIGVASAAVSAYVKTLLAKATLVADGIGYIAQGLEYAGVSGAVIDGMKNASSAMSAMISILWAPLDCITAWSAGGQDTAFYAAQNIIGTAIVSTLSANADAKQREQAAAGTSTLGQLKDQALALKASAQPAVTALSAIAQAKGVYDAAAAGNIGWESSAYEAWGSQSSLSVYTTCMAQQGAGVVSAVGAVAP